MKVDTILKIIVTVLELVIAIVRKEQGGNRPDSEDEKIIDRV